MLVCRIYSVYFFIIHITVVIAVAREQIVIEVYLFAFQIKVHGVSNRIINVYLTILVRLVFLQDNGLTNPAVTVNHMTDLEFEEIATSEAQINSRNEDIVKRAKELTGGYGPTVTIDAACVKGSLLNACQAAGNATRVITMGFSIAPDEINQFVITSKELDIRGSRLQNRKFGEVIKLVNEHKVNLNGAVSHTFPFLEAQKAFDFVDSRDPSIRKISLMFD